jgi:hypothetical protein
MHVWLLMWVMVWGKGRGVYFNKNEAIMIRWLWVRPSLMPVVFVYYSVSPIAVFDVNANASCSAFSAGQAFLVVD